MRCCDVEALWDEMREGVEPRREHVHAHLRYCKTCQDLYQEFEGVAYCLSALPVVEPPHSLVPRILEHIESMRHHYKTLKPDSLARIQSPLGDLFVAWRKSSGGCGVRSARPSRRSGWPKRCGITSAPGKWT